MTLPLSTRADDLIELMDDLVGVALQLLSSVFCEFLDGRLG